MPDEIYGVMAVKNGQKQTIMNLSNARQKSYADLQTMTDAQKKGVIVCPDYPKEEFLVTADEVSYGSGTVKDALDVIGDTSVYSFFSNKVKVTRTGSIVIAQFTGAEASNFISGGRFVETAFLDNYPDLKPSLAVLGVGLLYRNDNENYTATIEVGTNGRVIMTYKTAVNTRTTVIADSNYRIYGSMTWLKE